MELQQVQWNELISMSFGIGLLGLILLIAGARLYRLLVMSPGFLLGGYVGYTQVAFGAPEVQLGIIGVMSVVGGVLMLMIEQLAVSLLGALLGGGGTVLVASVALGHWIF